MTIELGKRYLVVDTISHDPVIIIATTCQRDLNLLARIAKLPVSISETNEKPLVEFSYL